MEKENKSQKNSTIYWIISATAALIFYKHCDQHTKNLKTSVVLPIGQLLVLVIMYPIFEGIERSIFDNLHFIQVDLSSNIKIV